jgi:DNA mismatch repair protein MutS2
LQEIRQTLIAARDLKRSISRLAEQYPRLADMAQRIEECPGVVNEIGQAIDERGEVKDSASPTLGRIRRDIEITHGRLMEKLNRLVASSQNQHYLQEPLVTQREGRYVVPLKAEFKGKIRGLIHDQSASGATLFIEPLATVDLNNQWRQLQLDEADEIRRILIALADLVREHGRFISHTVVALADLDLAFAKAKYALALGATMPLLAELSQSGPQPTFKLLAARHPLLDPDTVVPIDLVLPDGVRMLVITGPNTGGKTVSLKTVGLLAAMAQAGLWIPAAEGSSLPIFNHILADIGDEQSIEQSLSTFSGHLTNIVQILATCDPGSLLIFDELGAGTDPIEGSALARSILTHLLEQGVTTFVATHFSELKAFAHTTPGVVNASMQFDLETLAPTYHLEIGLPGASNAFAIAQRLGLPPAIIERAGGLVGEDAQKVEAMLAQIRAEVETAHQVRRQAEAERSQAEAVTAELKRRLAEIDQERQDILSSVRADARAEIKAVREEIRVLQEQARQIGQTQDVAGAEDIPETDPARLETLQSALDSLEIGIEAKARPQAPKKEATGPLQAGDQVFISQFNTVGQVVAIQNKQVEVQLGNFRATVPLAEVELRARGRVAAGKETEIRVRLPEVESPGMELDLRGQVAEEAMLRLDQYLDQAFMARLPWVRIIHGRGSGTLRQIVRQELRGHPMVSSYRAGEAGEGGDGVTVAKLALS